MTRLPTQSRWLITALLAAWLPLCFCQAAGVVRAGLSVAGFSVPAGASDCGSCCMSKQRSSAPTTAKAKTTCCGTTLKLAPRPDRWSPTEAPAVDAPALPSPALAALCGSPHRARPEAHAAPPLGAAQTLLRQHCALTI